MTDLLPPRRTTIADIARALDLSAASVAMALSGRGGNTRVGEETRRRVVLMAQQMNYRSNSSARAMRDQRFNNIGFFIVRKAADDYSFSEFILDGISAAAARHGQNVILVRIPERGNTSREIPKALRESCLDALVIENVSNIPPEFQHAVESSGIPVVYLNEKKPVNSVYMDDVYGGRLMTQHLLDQGFRRIAMLAPDLNKNHHSFIDRIEGYRQVMQDAGLPQTVLREEREHWKMRTREWLSTGTRPEAIFCADDQIALSLERILYALNIHLPEDIAVAGCNGEMFSKYSILPLTTLQIPFYRMAEAAAEMAITMVAQNTREVPSICLRPELIVEASTLRGRSV